MTKVFLFRETPKIRKILNDSYDSLLTALRVVKLNAKNLIGNDANSEIYSQLHDILSLIKSRQIRVQCLNGEEDDGILESL